MRQTDNFDLNLVEGNDIVNPLVQDVPNYQKIDEVMKENQDASITSATELLTGTVHAITRDKTNSPMFRFVATSKYTTGDTFTVDGVQVTALLTTGEPLATGSYVIGSNVLCCLTGTLLTVYACVGAERKASDSDKLNGQTASYYASKEEVNNALSVAQNANTISLNNQTAISNIELGLTNDSELIEKELGNGWTISYANLGNNMVQFCITKIDAGTSLHTGGFVYLNVDLPFIPLFGARLHSDIHSNGVPFGQCIAQFYKTSKRLAYCVNCTSPSTMELNIWGIVKVSAITG